MNRFDPEMHDETAERALFALRVAREARTPALNFDDVLARANASQRRERPLLVRLATHARFTVAAAASVLLVRNFSSFEDGTALRAAAERTHETASADAKGPRAEQTRGASALACRESAENMCSMDAMRTAMSIVSALDAPIRDERLSMSTVEPVLACKPNESGESGEVTSCGLWP